MISSDSFWQRAEHELHTQRTLGTHTLEDFTNIPVQSRIAYLRAMIFLGFKLTNGQIADSGSDTLESDRVKAVRLMLLKLGLDLSDPRWSSLLLSRLLKAVIETPDGTVGDLLKGLHEVLGEYSCELTKPVVNFIQDIVVACFTRHRELYESIDWSWLTQKLLRGATPAQAYLAFLALPPGKKSPQLMVAILQSLETTCCWEEAVVAMEDDLQTQEGRKLLKGWLAAGIHVSRISDVERLIGRN